LAALMAGDNGEAGAGGQRTRRAFPKGFIGVLSSLLLDLSDRLNPIRRISFSTAF
jgi:hypothetical protein